MILKLHRTQTRIIAFLLILILFVLFVYSTSFSVDGVTSGGVRVIVSIGDSYSSGEGIEPFYYQDEDMSVKTSEPFDWLAHRSENSWPGRLTLPEVDGTMSQNRNKNWYFVAASGATTADITGKQEKTYYKNADPKDYSGIAYLPAQIDVFDALDEESKEADYVTLTLGGNDADFTGVVTKVVTGVNYFDKSGLSKKINETWEKYYKEGGIEDRLKSTYELIEERTKSRAQIIVAGYPRLLEENGKGVLVSKEEAGIVNSAVSNFNNAIEHLVNECSTSGMNISFVSVEDAFKGHAAYSDDPYINEVILGTKEQDLMDFEVYLIKKADGSKKIQPSVASAYSMHPNYAGAQKYADCVQDKIDELESIKQNANDKDTKIRATSSERDIVLVLDTSGSMDGTPLDETKKAATNFVDTILEEDASIGVVNYDNEADVASDFANSKNALDSVINDLGTGGGTDIEAGMRMADDMLSQSSAKKKFIVLMSDGEPNDGLVGDELIAYAEELKNKGIYIYTLGFFESLGDKTSAQSLMEKIASEGCHYEVSDADSLVFFFGDIADQINGQKYIYVRIACPVDVSVTHNGETLNSSDKDLNTRTPFGTLSFEESDSWLGDNSYGQQNDSGEANIWFDENLGDQDSDSEESEDRVKILRLKEGEDYDIAIEGTGRGKMNYSIGFMDENGEYTDFRKFNNIKITKSTKVDTVANVSDKTVLNVDEDGDGRYDLVYKAEANGNGELVDYTYVIYIVIGVVSAIAVLILVLVIRAKLKKRKLSKTK